MLGRYFLDISYDGSPYHGWQAQINAHSVQEEIETALTTLLREPISILGSGRTDKGVHAKQQIAHVDLNNDLEPAELAFKMNALMPLSVGINEIKKVNPETHARFDATSRSYEYHIALRKDPFTEKFAYYHSHSLNVAAMNEAAEHLLGKHDFESYSKVKTDVNTFNCEVSSMNWEVRQNSLVFHVSANRFLRGMVRALVGTLLEVGQDKLNIEQFRTILEAKDRTKAGRSVPPHGLFLSQVDYPSHIYA